MKHPNTKRTTRWIAVPLSLLLTAALLAGCSSTDGGNNSATPAVKDADLTISVSEISPKVTFYPVEVDGTQLEVLAVKAPDDTIRTAFNTCQVCFDSGRGYYKQEGDKLVCQNCGNRFAMDEVEVISGGCNPVPILPENKTPTDDSITVPLEFLQEATVIFSNWRTSY